MGGVVCGGWSNLITAAQVDKAFRRKQIIYAGGVEQCPLMRMNGYCD